METVRWLNISYQQRMSNTAIRGVYPEYGEIRNEVPDEGRWISPEDFLERRRVVFLGSRLRKKLFAGRPSIGETVRIDGVRFTSLWAGLDLMVLPRENAIYKQGEDILINGIGHAGILLHPKTLRQVSERLRTGQDIPSTGLERAALFAKGIYSKLRRPE